MMKLWVLPWYSHQMILFQSLDTLFTNPFKIFMRCERQTLYRLPSSGDIVSSVKTCQYPLSDLKAEGSREDLAAAILGLRTGGDSNIAFYKRENVWGKTVRAYLCCQEVSPCRAGQLQND